MSYPARLLVALAAAAATAVAASAGPMTVTVTIQNLSPANSTAFAPLRVGFGNGTFDAFNVGSVQAANAPITSIAEGGSGAAWFPAFRSAEPNAVLGSVGGALLPGQTASNRFTVDPLANPFFTFGTMVIPSNDLFLGNDSPTRFRLFDANGNLALDRIDQFGRDIWDNGSELAIPANAAFLVGGNNDLRVDQNGVVSFSFSELAAYNGLTTAAGYQFNSGLVGATTPLYRISFTATAVPEPATVSLFAVGVVGAGVAARLHRRK